MPKQLMADRHDGAGQQGGGGDRGGVQGVSHRHLEQPQEDPEAHPGQNGENSDDPGVRGVGVVGQKDHHDGRYPPPSDRRSQPCDPRRHISRRQSQDGDTCHGDQPGVTHHHEDQPRHRGDEQEGAAGDRLIAGHGPTAAVEPSR